MLWKGSALEEVRGPVSDGAGCSLGLPRSLSWALQDPQQVRKDLKHYQNPHGTWSGQQIH